MLKLELLQHAGSFKPRGAFNRILAAQVPPSGVIAASGGDHGAAVAYVAQQLGMRAEIFVPELTPQAKRDRIASYGAEVVRTGATYSEALEASRARQTETSALEVHAYDHADVLAGQGTLGREIEAEAPDLTHLLIAVGGGGLIGGIAGWYAARANVVAVEPELCPALHDALDQGRPVPAHVGGVAADSLGARQVGGLMFDVARSFVRRSVLVPDEAIRAAQRALWDRLRLIVEPGGATAFAALLSGAWVPPEGARVGVVVCGANAEPGHDHDLSVSRETRPRVQAAFGSRTVKRAPHDPAVFAFTVLRGDAALQRLDDLPADRQSQSGVLPETARPAGRSE